MRIALLTSQSRRHAYLASKLGEQFELAIIIREEKGFANAFMEHPDRALIHDHFRQLENIESTFFFEFEWDKIRAPFHTVTRGKLNTEETISKIRNAKPDVIVLFGCGLIKQPIIDL